MQKLFVKITALVTVLIQLTACSESVQNSRSSSENTSQVTAVKVSEETTTKKTVAETTVEEPFVLPPFSVSLSSDTVAKYSSEISNLKIQYYYEELFDTDEALKKYYSMKECSGYRKLEYINNGVIDEEKLKKHILDNNKAYLNEKKAGKYKALSDSEFKKIFGLVTDNLNLRLKDDIDVEQLDENLDYLKILDADIQELGLYSSNTSILAINMKLVKLQSKDNPGLLEDLCRHESNHLVSSCSPTELEKEKYSENVGLHYRWSDLKLNALGYKWLEEACAEELAKVCVEDYKGTMYQNKIAILNGMRLAYMYTPDTEPDTILKLSMQGDIDKLFSLYRLETENEKKEFINMLYTYEIFNDSFYNDFKELYKEKYGENFNPYNSISLECKCSEELSKLFYRNLLFSVENNEMNISQIFDSMFLFESYINVSTKIRGQSSEYNMDFAKVYNDAQDLFFEAICENSDIKPDEIHKAFDTYYKDKGEKDFNINGFSDSKNSFLNSMYTDYAYFALSKSLSSLYQDYLKEE